MPGTGAAAAVKARRPKVKCVPSSLLFAGLVLFATGAAQAKVAITVDKNNPDTMTVADQWRSNAPHGNPLNQRSIGRGAERHFRTFRMEADHLSKEFDDAPMPHSISSQAGMRSTAPSPEAASARPPRTAACGCRAQRLDTSCAGEAQGVLNTTVTLTGSSRSPWRAIRVPPNPPPSPAAKVAPSCNPAQYDSAGNPVDLTPPQVAQRPLYPQQGYTQQGYPQQAMPQQRARLMVKLTARWFVERTAIPPAPPGYRRLYDAQAVPQQQYYYDNRGYAPPLSAAGLCAAACITSRAGYSTELHSARARSPLKVTSLGSGSEPRLFMFDGRVLR